MNDLFTLVRENEPVDRAAYAYFWEKFRVRKHPEIALCTLAAYNLGQVRHLDDLEDYARVTVRFLDELLSYQDYPVAAAKYATHRRRPLGIGVINYAYYLAKNGTKYSDPAALKLTHELFEALSYFTIQASVELAEEKGPCEGLVDTKWADGVLPIDTYKRTIDEFAAFDYRYDWEKLRERLKRSGIRNSTLLALMPAETSAQISNSTNGIEPPRALVSVKSSKDGAFKQVVPEIHRLKNHYELLWDIPNMDGVIKLVAIMSKFVDQAISTNLSYDPRKFPDGKIPMQVLLADYLKTVKYGVKHLYYHNTYDGNKQQLDEDNVPELKVTANLPDPAEDDCGDACKI